MTIQRNADVVFEVIQETDGGYVAECVTENIVTQGDTWEDLRAMVVDAVEGCFLMARNLKRFDCSLFAMKFS